jgi:hypothetical protein
VAGGDETGQGKAEGEPADGRGPEGQTAATDARKAGRDTELAKLMKKWPTLPPAIRAGIVAMIEASG